MELSQPVYHIGKKRRVRFWVNEFVGTLFTLAKDVKLQFEFNH